MQCFRRLARIKMAAQLDLNYIVRTDYYIVRTDY